MALNLVNLDSKTRKLMIQEIDLDIAADTLYRGKTLSPDGLAVYDLLLREAAEHWDDSWLAQQLIGKFNETEDVTIKGKPVTREMRRNAPEVRAEGEFNRFYIRGLCLRAIEDNIPALVIYRAKDVKNPRPESQEKIGTTVSPSELLADARLDPEINQNPIVPTGPGSGLSVKLP